MKLYTRRHLVYSCIAGVFATVLAAGIVFFAVTGIKNHKENLTDSAEENNSETEFSETDKSADSVYAHVLDELQQNPGVIEISTSANSSYTKEELQNISVYELCNEAVVNINTKVVAYDWFLSPYVEDGGSGSGSIIDKRGYVLTNVHVIQGASKIYVSLSDGTQYEASVVGQDLDSDLAIIKFEPEAGMELKTISFGDSSALKVGQRVIAIGNPFGLERTMTTGIVSSLGRSIKNSNDRIIRNMIQTDAAINPGNSGGPLLDTNGKMIGINTSIASSTQSSAGIGFSVPSETAVRVVSDLLKYGKVQRGTLDANVIELNSRIVRYAGIDVDYGVLVSEVEKGGNSEKAGLRGGTESVRYGNTIFNIGGDVITKIDNIQITSIADFYSALESKKPGDIIKVTVRRKHQDLTLNITLGN